MTMREIATERSFGKGGDMMDIKTCPFCGGKAGYESTQHKYGIVYSVYCEECGAEIARLNDQEVIEAWNRRIE